jgi:hypothetical protein
MHRGLMAPCLWLGCLHWVRSPAKYWLSVLAFIRRQFGFVDENGKSASRVLECLRTQEARWNSGRTG